MEQGEEGDRGLTLGQRLRRYVIAGLLVWAPVIATLFILRFIVGLLDLTILLLPASWRPESLVGFGVPGLGMLLAFIVLLATGVAVANLFGRRLVAWWERQMARIPFVRTIYSGAKTFTETVLSDTGKAFKQVLLVEYPRKGAWTLGFQSGEGVGEASHVTGKDLVCVFVPTTPNPTSGFIIMVSRDEVIPLSMSVDQAMRLIFTLGVAAPEWPPATKGKTVEAGEAPPAQGNS